MDLDYLTEIVKHDDRGRFPSAERALRQLMGNPSFKRGGKTKKSTAMNRYPQISDPEGLIRSLHSKSVGGSGHKTIRQHTRRLR